VGIIEERIAIDLGTAYSIVAHESSNELWRIPSSVAVDRQTREPVAYGNDAKIMFGKGEAHYEVIRPLRDGVICDFEAAGHYLSYLVHKSRRNPLALKYLILVCVPWGATRAETKSYLERVRGFRTQVKIVREPFAAALGAGEDIFSTSGCTVVDIGGGTVEVSTIAHGHMILCHSHRGSGNAMDQAICERMLRQEYFEVGLNTAEAIKMEHGSVFKVFDDYEFEVRGLDRRTHSPGKLMLSTSRLRDFLEPLAESIERQIQEHLSHLPPQFQTTVKENGIRFVGGGAHLKGWTERLSRNLGLKIQIPADPQLAVIRGMKKILMDPKKYSAIVKISEKV
jgi:rod shape-determining protein MreB